MPQTQCRSSFGPVMADAGDTPDEASTLAVHEPQLTTPPRFHIHIPSISHFTFPAENMPTKHARRGALIVTRPVAHGTHARSMSLRLESRCIWTL